MDTQITDDPAPSKVLAHLRSSLREQARERYRQAFALKEASPAQARKGFQRVLDWTLPEDALHQKAQEELQQFPKK